MAVATAEITTLYNSLIADHKVVLDAEFDEKRIDGDLYAKALLSFMQQSMQIAISTVQQQPVLDAQKDKTEADTAFVETQDAELSNSVTFNNKIKALDSYGDMIGTMGAGSLNITTDMWTAFFNMVGDLNTSMGANPVDTNVEKLS